MLGLIWRFFAALFDWRTFFKALFNKPTYEVVFITNIRDKVDKKRFLGKFIPRLGHFNGPRFNFLGVSGRTRAINSLSVDITRESAKLALAKEQIISAIEHVQEKGAKVILLAASTKKLFGTFGEEIVDMFPNLNFTIGDNGTFFLLFSETIRALNKAGLDNSNSRICVVGAYGLLGTQMVAHLTNKGYNVVGLGPSLPRLRKMQETYNMEIAENYEALGKVDAVVACNHSSIVMLNQVNIDLIRRPGKKLLVIDVSEPSNLTEVEYNKPVKVVKNENGEIIKTYKSVKDMVVRQDAGNGYSPNLRYVLGFITYKMFRLTQGVTFGCFMETLVWRKAMKDNPDDQALRKLELFKVNDENIKIISELFNRYDVRIPSPRCFGKRVKSFDLDIDQHDDKKNDSNSSLEDD